MDMCSLLERAETKLRNLMDEAKELEVELNIMTSWVNSSIVQGVELESVSAVGMRKITRAHSLEDEIFVTKLLIEEYKNAKSFSSSCH